MVDTLHYIDLLKTCITQNADFAQFAMFNMHIATRTPIHASQGCLYALIGRVQRCEGPWATSDSETHGTKDMHWA